MKRKKTVIYFSIFLVLTSIFLINIKSNKTINITILHTNDVHSHIDAFSENDKEFPNMGGFAKRSTIINQIRESKEHVLLFDSGDFFQGTPYFNFYNGELEIKLMSLLKYDAVTLGNHEFDNGIEHLSTQLSKAYFPIILANYDVSNTLLKDQIKPWKIFNFKGVKIGVTGVGVNPDGLISSNNITGVIYNNPFEVANNTAKFLKKEHNCDFVILLSHLGAYMETEIDDLHLAKSSKHIDMILGGHTHIFLDTLISVKNSIGKDVTIHQSGWGGIKIEQIDLEFTKRR